MDKIDLKSELKFLYKPSAREVVEVDVPAFKFLMIDGNGNPNTSREYKQAVEAPYSVSYAIKFVLKRKKGLDYVVMPLEGCGGPMTWPASIATRRTAGSGQ